MEQLRKLTHEELAEAYSRAFPKATSMTIQLFDELRAQGGGVGRLETSQKLLHRKSGDLMEVSSLQDQLHQLVWKELDQLLEDMLTFGPTTDFEA